MDVKNGEEEDGASGVMTGKRSSTASGVSEEVDGGLRNDGCVVVVEVCALPAEGCDCGLGVAN